MDVPQASFRTRRFVLTVQQILAAYGLAGASAVPFGTGLINHTWTVTEGGRSYILQRINENVFRQPQIIAQNIRRIATFLREHHPSYFFAAPIETEQGTDMVSDGKGWYRLFPFVSGAVSREVVQSATEAYEAAVQFGRFTRMLADFDVSLLAPAIPQFHDLSLRYRQFREALQMGDGERIVACREEIHMLEQNATIVTEYEAIVAESRLPLRVIHHDTKISNVLFDASGKGLCVIDLDTVMGGYIISDLGDMMRTYLSPVSEEETDLSKIVIREDIYQAIVQGYQDEMKDELTTTEREHFFYSGQFMIYMQALRFLTDHLNNDRYYGARYEGHNLLRAKNQMALLERLGECRNRLNR